MMKKLQYGAFVRHIAGIYKSTWTDMFIETVFMRLGHGPTGATWTVTDYHHMVKWVIGFGLGGEVSQSVRSLSNTELDSQHTRHKEEAEARTTDQAARQSMRDTFHVSSEPLDYASNPDGEFMNIVTGQIAHPGVNVDNAVGLGHRAMENAKGGRPDSLYCPLGKLDVSMDVKKNHMLVGRNVSMTRNSSTHVSLVYLQAHERSTSIICCWSLS